MPSSKRTAKPLRGNKYGGSVHGMPGPGVSYSAINGQLLHDAVIAVTGNGDAITFGRTAERGAYYVGILCDGTLEKFYLDSGDACEECLRGVAAVVDSVVE